MAKNWTGDVRTQDCLCCPDDGQKYALTSLFLVLALACINFTQIQVPSEGLRVCDVVAKYHLLVLASFTASEKSC